MSDFYGDESPVEERKICTCCAMEKPLSEFRVLMDKSQHLRRHSWCRACGNLADQARRDRLCKQKPSAVRARDRAKAQSYRERNQDRYNAYHRRYRQQQKRKAFEQIMGGAGR